MVEEEIKDLSNAFPQNKKQIIGEENRIATLFNEGSDAQFSGREKEILEDVANNTGFEPVELLNRSSVSWGSFATGEGALHYSGKYYGKDAVMKIQGLKPSTSEIDILQEFAKRNKSKFVRPPHLYGFVPWNEQKKYEALILEDIGNNKVVHLPATQQDVNEFIRFYEDYTMNCVSDPWLKKPISTISERLPSYYRRNLQINAEKYSKHPYKQPEDELLANNAFDILINGYKGIDYVFQHAHLTETDLYHVDNQIVVLSNIFWGYRTPFYDAVLLQHHYTSHHLADVEGMTVEKLEEQRQMWLDAIQSLPETQGQNQRLLKLALLERATAGLMVDALSIKLDNPLAETFIEKTRNQVKKLSKELK